MDHRTKLLITMSQRLTAMNRRLNDQIQRRLAFGDQVSIAQDMKDTRDIIARYDEGEMKARLFWFRTNHNDIFEIVMDMQEQE